MKDKKKASVAIILILAVASAALAVLKLKSGAMVDGLLWGIVSLASVIRIIFICRKANRKNKE